MAPPSDIQIAKTLRRVVRETQGKGSAITVNEARSQAEAKLKLDNGFLKGDLWKNKSKEIIKTAFDGPSESSEDDSDSDSESEEGSDSSSGDEAVPTPTKALPQAQVGGVKRKGVSDSSETSSSEDESSDAEANGTPQTKKHKALPVDDSSEEDSDEDIPADPSDQLTGPSSIPLLATPAKVKEAAASAAAIPAGRFQPPAGFVPVPTKPSTKLTASLLAGKQVWHLVAPSHLPLDSLLTSIPLSALGDATSTSSSSPLLTHNGVPYVARVDTSTHQPHSVLLPSKDTYTSISQRVDRIVRLQPHLELPQISTSASTTARGLTQNAAASASTAGVTQIRPQPRGMRMRFTPLGCVDNIGLDSDSDGEGGAREQPKATPKKSSKKAKKMPAEPAQQFPATIGGSSGEATTAQAPSGKDVEMVDVDAETEGKMAEVVKVRTEGKETKEEKERRKMEKKARKEAKKEKRKSGAA